MYILNTRYQWDAGSLDLEKWKIISLLKYLFLSIFHFNYSPPNFLNRVV